MCLYMRGRGGGGRQIDRQSGLGGPGLSKCSRASATMYRFQDHGPFFTFSSGHWWIQLLTAS